LISLFLYVMVAKKDFNHFFIGDVMNASVHLSLKSFIYVILLLLPTEAFSAIAYISQPLKDCVHTIHRSISTNNYTDAMNELYDIINENRILSSDALMYRALEDTLALLKQNKGKISEEQRKNIKKYIKKYIKSLRSKQMLLTIKSSAQTKTWPAAFLDHALEKSSPANADIIYLNNERIASENMVICGDLQKRSSMFDPVITRKTSSAIFNANDMTNMQSTTPTIVFGTGVASPIINAWIMTPSDTTQYPMNIEFAVPKDLQKGKTVTLELHFLIQQNSTTTGNARVQINAKYMHQDSTFDILDTTPHFTSTHMSDDFTVSEPSSATSVKHITVSITISSSSIKPDDLAYLSITRVAPSSGTEYDNDIYLAAAAFQYTS